jgi:Putative prokaryotic signal transducing protein
MALVELAKFYNVFEASLAKGRLDAEEIGSVLFDTEMNWGGLDGVVPVRLMVDEDDLDFARRVLAEMPL